MFGLILKKEIVGDGWINMGSILNDFITRLDERIGDLTDSISDKEKCISIIKLIIKDCEEKIIELKVIEWIVLNVERI